MELSVDIGVERGLIFFGLYKEVTYNLALVKLQNPVISLPWDPHPCGCTAPSEIAPDCWN